MRARPPLDLVLVAGLTLANSILLQLPVPTPIALVVGLPAILVAPGYATVAALFPSRVGQDRLPPLERASFTLFTTLVILPVLGLSLSTLPGGLTKERALFVVGGFTFTMLAVAYVRHDRAAPRPPPKRELHRRDKWAVLGLVIAAMTVVGSWVWVMSLEPQAETDTAFYVLGDGQTLREPRTIRVGEPVDFTVGIVNREGRAMEYLVLGNLVREAESTQVLRYEIELPDQASIEENHRISPATAGRYLLRLELYVGGEEPYRSLHVHLDVVE